MQEPQVRIAEIDTPEVGTTWPVARIGRRSAGATDPIRIVVEVFCGIAAWREAKHPAAEPSWQQQASSRIFARSSPNGRRGEPSLIPLSPKVHLLGHDSTAEGDIFWVRSAGPLADAPRPFSSCSPAAPRRKMRDGGRNAPDLSRPRTLPAPTTCSSSASATWRKHRPESAPPPIRSLWGSSPPGSSRRAGGYSSVLRLTADEVSLPYSPVPKSSPSGARLYLPRGTFWVRSAPVRSRTPQGRFPPARLLHPGGRCGQRRCTWPVFHIRRTKRLFGRSSKTMG